MTEVNEVFNKVNIRHFKLLEYLLENMDDEHIMCRISCIIRSDRVDTPHYMDLKVKLTHCTGVYEKGVIHAMDIFNHQRMYNLTEDKFMLINDTFNKLFQEDEYITLRQEDKLNQLTILTKSSHELKNILNQYEEFFTLIDKTV